jgi:hypothetical protein
LFDTTAEGNDGQNRGRTDRRSNGDACGPRSAASELPDGHKSDGTEDKERVEPVDEERGITRHVRTGKRIEPDADDKNDDYDTYAQKGLCEIFRERGKSEGENTEDEREGELHQDEAAEIGEYGKTGVMHKKKLDMEQRHTDEDKDEEEFGKKKLPPNIRLGDPPLAIANKAFALHDAKNEEDPREYKEKRDVAVRKEEEERRDCVVPG